MHTHLTAEELIALLQRSSLSTILVEGKDDMLMYRWIEDRVGSSLANVLPCGGRSTLLEIYRRRSEIPNSKVVFLADRDSFTYTGLPPGTEDIIWTKGYSIENDVYEGKGLEALLGSEELVEFRIALDNFIQHYAREYDALMQGVAHEFARHPSEVLDADGRLKEPFSTQVISTPAHAETIERFRADYELQLRGKSLFALLIRILSHTSRTVKHSYKSLCETAVKITNPAAVERIVAECKLKLAT